MRRVLSLAGALRLPDLRLTAQRARVTRSWGAYVIVALIALCASLPGITRMPVMDVDEARFAQASRQMLETGDFVRIRLQDNERNRKPAGVHWLQAASARAFEPLTGRLNAIWTYRIPSILGAVLAALATLWAGRALFGAGPALLGASLLSAGVLVGFEGMTAKTDALMLGFTTLAVAALAHLRAAALGFAAARSARTTHAIALLFWVALGCAILIKGPIPIMVVGLTLLTLALWERRAAGWMAPLAWWPGPAAALLLILPWGIAIGLATEWRFFTAAFTQDLAPKLTGADHAHNGFVGYHLMLLPLLMFPAGFALPAAARLAVAKHHAPADESAVRFLIAWAAPALLLMELSPAKLVHYAMPVYPPIALLCAAGFLAAAKHRWRVTLALGFTLFCVTGAALVGAVGFGLWSIGVTSFQVAAATAACALIAAMGAVGLAMLRQTHLRAAAAIACALALSFTLRSLIFPEARALQVSAQAAAAINAEEARGALWIVGYDEPSVVFLTRTSARLAAPETVGAGAREGDLILVEQADLPAIAHALNERGLVFSQNAAPIEGLSLSSNRRVALLPGVVKPANRVFADGVR
jgi:4-amino-4-deoxy-L-arabinose transferase-like glycosyltransferase